MCILYVMLGIPKYTGTAQTFVLFFTRWFTSAFNFWSLLGSFYKKIFQGEVELLLMGERMMEKYEDLLQDYHSQDFIFRKTCKSLKDFLFD